MSKFINLTESELLDLLEANGFAATYTNLCLLKEGIKTGSIVLEAEEEAPVEEEIPAEEQTVEEESTEDASTEGEAPAESEVPVEGEEVPQEEQMPAEGAESGARITISMPVDGSMTIDNQGKQVVADAEGNVQVALTENKRFLYAKHTERLLKSYLTEDCEMSLKEYVTLTEDTKVDSVREIAMNLLKMVEEKVASIDTTAADRSRGDIKKLKELDPIQKAITQLETMIERADDVNPICTTAVTTIIKAILHINQYSAVFKEAYREKKTVMILKYQSLILSVISSLTYLLSVMVDYKGGDVKLKTNINTDLMNFAPLKSLEAFNASVESGEFRTMANDVNTLREYYLEVPVEQMSTILEASEFTDMVIGGVKNIFNQLADGEMGGKVLDILYKAIGIITLLFSLRSTLYTIFRMKTRVSDMISGIQNFVGINNGNGGSLLNKLTQFTNKFKADAENGSDISEREIETENKRVLNQVRDVQNSSVIKPEPVREIQPEALVSNPTIDTKNDDFGFDF